MKIAKTIYVDEEIVKVLCTINVKEFKGSFFFPRFQGEDEESK